MIASPMRPRLRFLYHPVSLVLIFMFAMLAIVLAANRGDPLALVQVGTYYASGDAQGSQGYDGQFVYYMALDLHPQRVAARLDAPAYRYQRILLPVLARLVGLGNPALIPWTIPLVNLAGHALGVWAMAALLAGWGLPRRYALVYGLFAGFTLAVRLDLPEPLAFGLAVLAFWCGEQGQVRRRAWLFGLAAFAKETILPLAVAQVLADLVNRRWRAAGWGAAALLPFAAFQGWLWIVFGVPGLGSGGAMATPFEWIPFMGLWRIGAYSWVYLLGMLAVFGPAVILPAVWGAWAAVRAWLSGDRQVYAVGLFLQALLIASLPFSTFRETGGLLRFACSFVLAVLLFAGQRRLLRLLNYSFLWLVLNVFLLK
jgi:hypothetical protein